MRSESTRRYSRDYWMLRGELIWNQWQVPTLSQRLNATSAFLEGRYKILPGLFVASRIDYLGFSALRIILGHSLVGRARSRGSRRAPAFTFDVTCSRRPPTSTTGETAVQSGAWACSPPNCTSGSSVTP